MTAPLMQRIHLSLAYSTQSCTLLQNYSPDVVCSDVSQSCAPDGSNKGAMCWPSEAHWTQQKLCCSHTAPSTDTSHTATNPKACRNISHASYWGQIRAKQGFIKPRWALLVMYCHGTCQGKKRSGCMHAAGVEVLHVSRCNRIGKPFTLWKHTALQRELANTNSSAFCVPFTV